MVGPKVSFARRFHCSGLKFAAIALIVTGQCPTCTDEQDLYKNIHYYYNDDNNSNNKGIIKVQSDVVSYNLEVA